MLKHDFAMLSTLSVAIFTTWLQTPYNNLMYLCKDYMASTLQKLVIPIFGYCNL